MPTRYDRMQRDFRRQVNYGHFQPSDFNKYLKGRGMQQVGVRDGTQRIGFIPGSSADPNRSKQPPAPPPPPTPPQPSVPERGGKRTFRNSAQPPHAKEKSEQPSQPPPAELAYSNPNSTTASPTAARVGAIQLPQLPKPQTMAAATANATKIFQPQVERQRAEYYSTVPPASSAKTKITVSARPAGVGVVGKYPGWRPKPKALQTGPPQPPTMAAATERAKQTLQPALDKFHQQLAGESDRPNEMPIIYRNGGKPSPEENTAYKADGLWTMSAGDKDTVKKTESMLVADAGIGGLGIQLPNSNKSSVEREAAWRQNLNEAEQRLVSSDYPDTVTGDFQKSSDLYKFNSNKVINGIKDIVSALSPSEQKDFAKRFEQAYSGVVDTLTGGVGAAASPFPALTPDFIEKPVEKIFGTLGNLGEKGVSKLIDALGGDPDSVIGRKAAEAGGLLAQIWSGKAAAEVGGRVTRGVKIPKPKFIQPTRAKSAGDVVIKVDINKLDADWSKNKDSYIDSSGKGQIGDRRGEFQKYLESGEPVEMPELAFKKNPDGSSSFNFTNGRHRFSVLRDQGAETVEISIPKNDLKNFKSYLLD